MLTESVDPSEMFEHYLYVSDTSETLTNYFTGMANWIVSKNPDAESICEIACNSGLFLKMFADKGLKCFGVDPAKNLRQMSEDRGLDVDVCFWDDENADRISKDKKFDIVIAVNVFPHVPDPVSFLINCKKILSPEGKIYIQTSQCDMFKNEEFDAVYHEHVSYFTATSFGELANSIGLGITSFKKVPIHSMSFVFELEIDSFNCEDYINYIEREDALGYNDIITYEIFAKKAEFIKNNLVKKVEEYQSIGKKVIGYGASAKGNTLLNWSKIKLDYIVDDNELKWGYLTPGQNIPIVPPQTLYSELESVVILCLAWNFLDEIYNNVKSNTDIPHQFIKYFPNVQVLK
jgi:SAM-dependent methyltransferase